MAEWTRKSWCEHARATPGRGYMIVGAAGHVPQPDHNGRWVLHPGHESAYALAPWEVGFDDDVLPIVREVPLIFAFDTHVRAVRSYCAAYPTTIAQSMCRASESARAEECCQVVAWINVHRTLDVIGAFNARTGLPMSDEQGMTRFLGPIRRYLLSLPEVPA